MRRLAYEAKEVEPSDEIPTRNRALMEMGKYLEPLVKRLMREDGWEVSDEGAVELPHGRIILTGHPDGVASHPVKTAGTACRHRGQDAIGVDGRVRLAGGRRAHSPRRREPGGAVQHGAVRGDSGHRGCHYGPRLRGLQGGADTRRPREAGIRQGDEARERDRPHGAEGRDT